MMKRRGLIICVAIAGLVTASIAVAVAAYIQRLPEPEQADRPGLFRWLVQTRLRDESPDIQTRLLNRVEQELIQGIDLTQCLTQIDATQTARLRENVDRLAECWFFREAGLFFAEPQAGRMNLIRVQAERVRKLGILEQIAVLEGNGNDSAKARMASVADNARRLDRWLTDVPPQQRAQLNEYFSALRGALVWNNIQNWLTPLTPSALFPSTLRPLQMPAAKSAKQTAA